MYWLYVIEYANFNCQEAFDETLTKEGFKQGGLGMGVCGVPTWDAYNGSTALVPNGYLNELGNSSNIKIMNLVIPTSNDDDTPMLKVQYVPKYRGIENTFGDIYTALDGVVCLDNTDHQDIYITDNPSLYNKYDLYKFIGSINTQGYIREFNLGNTAEIIPRLLTGNSSTYKCDYWWFIPSTSPVVTLLVVAGMAAYGVAAGISTAHTWYDVNGDTSGWVGFRSSCIIK